MIRKNTINRTIEVVFTLYGIWPDTSHIPFRTVFWIIITIIIQFYHCRYFWTHFHSDDFFNLMDCLSSLIAYMKVMIEIIVFCLNQRKFKKSLEMMTEDWNNCIDNEIDMHEMICKAKLSNRISNAMIIFHIISVLIYSTHIILADIDVNNRTSELPYIHKMELPFYVTTQRTYKMILLTQTVICMSMSVFRCSINASLLTLILYIGSQMDILCYWLMNFASKESGKKNRLITMDKIIQKHQKIINFSKNVENLYTFIALLLFASNTIMICSLAFLIVSAIGTPDATEQIMRTLLFYILTNLETFIFCFAGEYLKIKSKAIGNAAYNSAWYNLKSENSRILSFIILRSQKQLTLTVGKMAELSLEYFTSVMNASGSYLSVMLAMQ